MGKIITEQEVSGQEAEIFQWLKKKLGSLLEIRITRFSDHLSLRYGYWKELPDEIEKELIEELSFRLEWIEDDDTGTNYYYTLRQ